MLKIAKSDTSVSMQIRRLTLKCCKNEALIKVSIRTLKAILIFEDRKSALCKTSFFLSLVLDFLMISVRETAMQKKLCMNLQ